MADGRETPRAAAALLIRVWVERTQPLAGTAVIENAEPRRFDGWLELLNVLAELVAAAPSAVEERDTFEAPIRDGRMGDDRDEEEVMRRVVVTEHLKLDGVMQAPGSAEEDPRGGFAHGG